MSTAMSTAMRVVARVSTASAPMKAPGGGEETVADDDEPPRYLRLAFDDVGRPWELAALSFGGGARHLVIHPLPARKSVIDKMQRRMR